MKKLLFYVIMCMCYMCTSCQSPEKIVDDAVNQVNASCPIAVSKIATITKVEFVNNEVIFYSTYDESEESFQDYTYQQLKKLESNPKFNKGTIQDIFRQPVIKEAFKNVSLKVAEELDLRFKAIVKGDTSNIEIVCKLSWRDALHNL